jgi:hypothetical protein
MRVKSMKTRLANKSNQLTREEAKLTLDQVRKRYGIPSREKQVSDPETRGIVQNIGPPLDLDWVYYQPGAANQPDSREAHRSGEKLSPKKEVFHYLVRIAECVLPLHCEVEAETAAAASQQVDKIRNLIASREISLKELAELRVKGVPKDRQSQPTDQGESKKTGSRSDHNQAPFSV